MPPMPSASLNCSQASTRATPSIPSRCLPTAPPPENPTHKPCTMSQIDLARINADLGRNSPDLVAWALGLGQPAIVTTNFRPFEAVILHMVTQVNPDVPVVWMDNGYNSEATYRFTEEVKLEPFARALRETAPKVWFTALRATDTAVRAQRDPVSINPDGLIKVAPLLHWSSKELHEYCVKHGLPNNFDYVDPTKGEDNRECGLHLAH